MSKVKINRNDSNRVLLTELLPYEVPMLFSNDGFYDIVSKGLHIHFFEKIKIARGGGALKYGIPFNYEVPKVNKQDSRLLSIIHPIKQFEFIEFYSKYNSVMISLCSKSPFSLRKISKVAKFCYSPDLLFDEDTSKNAEVETEPDVLDRESKVYKSYFVYKPIDLIYKFYERYEYRRLEQRFEHLLEFDISKCFHSIYTHSICWAVKDKETAKHNTDSVSFENRFDGLMREPNYNETNGIVVGPEISRVFAEIILQQIDINVLVKLEEKKFKNGVDFEIRRYVDDFFVYTNDVQIADCVLKFYKKELAYYKLYINDAKTNRRLPPFVTNIGVAKREVKKLVGAFFERIYHFYDNKLVFHKVGFKIGDDFIKDFQCIVRQNSTTYETVSKEVIRLLKQYLVQVLRNDADCSQEEILRFKLLVLDIAFYVYSLNIDASSTFKIAELIVISIKYSKDKSPDFRHTVFTKIYKDAEFSIVNQQRKLRKNEVSIEMLNLIIALKKLGEEYELTEKRLKEYFNLHDDTTKAYLSLNYFQIICLLYYIEDKQKYSDIRNMLSCAIIDKFSDQIDPFENADLFCLFFDSICCPYIDEKFKRKLVGITKYDKNITNAIIQIKEQKFWFMDWDKEIDLEKVLKKKQWSNAY